jgi:hypothetical protein
MSYVGKIETYIMKLYGELLSTITYTIHHVHSIGASKSITKTQKMRHFSSSTSITDHKPCCPH